MKAASITARTLPRWAGIALLGLAVLSGCAGNSRPKPTPLEPLSAPSSARIVWRQKIEAVQFPMAVAVNGGVFTAASSDGTVVALQADTGRELWRGQAGGRLGAGVGSDGRYAAVVTRDGVLVTLEAGRVLWRKPLGVRVDTPPLVAGERVFVLGADRSVHAFDAAEGAALWKVQRPGDPLTLAQPGVIASFRRHLLVGQGPRLAALEPSDGSVVWEVPVGAPRGTNEIERLADLVGPLARTGDLVCVRSFQAAVGCVHAERGTLAWTRPGGGTDPVAADTQLVVAADASDRISTWRPATGEPGWNSERLLHHRLGPPLIVGSQVVFGDDAGLLHLLARDNGRPLARVATDGSAIVSAPVLAAGTVLVVTRAGGIFALRTD